MRMNFKVITFCLCVGATIVTLSLWAKCGSEFTSIRRSLKQNTLAGFQFEERGITADGTTLEEIDCHINGEYTIPCRREGDEVYIPFSFIHKYFEVYGKLNSYDGYERFDWSHSYSKVYHPKGKYDPRSVFLFFENYNVEVRERVKCISAAEGVPVSTQWESQGYFYPTQIAQFALSHYSKNLTEIEPKILTLEDGASITADWNGKVIRDDGVLVFNTSDSGNLMLKTDHILDFILTVDLQLRNFENSSFIVKLQNREKRESWHLHYNCSNNHIYGKDHDIYHGMNCDDKSWIHLTRDLLIDLQKGLALQNKHKRKLSRAKYKVTGIILQGIGKLDNLTIGSSAHLRQFYAGATWFVKSQDPVTGGWPNPVRRKGPPGMIDLQPGWLSAMGQGHGISVLARAYYLLNDPIYLNSAISALKPFRTLSDNGGVLAYFTSSEEFPWYEEYPTRPASYVLNGFIYSLIGLYDLMTVAPPQQSKEAEELFQKGMESLKKLLPLYDNGAGSNYDLRHFSLGSAPNLARWDYHATHVNQLLLLSTIDKDPIFSVTAQRWIRYMSGKRASHN